MWEVKSCHLAAARRVKLWSLNANLFFEEPEQLTKFAFKIGPFKPCLAENVSLQSSNCNILRLAATLAFFANKARFKCSSGHVLSKTKSLIPPPPHFFTFLASLTHHLSMVKFSEKKKSMLENFRANVLNSERLAKLSVAEVGNFNSKFAI